MNYTHVEGKDNGKVVLYALSTCLWCRKTKEFLTNEGIEFDYIYVDKADEEDGRKLDNIVKKWNPRESFPTVVINDEMVIVGYKPDEIKSALSWEN